MVASHFAKQLETHRAVLQKEVEGRNGELQKVLGDQKGIFRQRLETTEAALSFGLWPACSSRHPRHTCLGLIEAMVSTAMLATFTEGHPVGVVVHASDIQDRDGAPLVLKEIRSL